MGRTKKDLWTIVIFFLAFLCALVWGLADVSWWLIPKSAGTVANAIAIFVTVFGILSIRKEWQETQKNVQRGIDVNNPRTQIFIDKALEDKASAKQIQNCLQDDGSDLDESSISAPDQLYVALEDRLKNCKWVVVPYYHTPVSWVIQRLRLYKKLRILNKVIICTNQQMTNIPADLRESVKKVIFSKQESCNCEELRNFAINKN